ncbi:MAG TPA: NUDIX domain-containing protein [Ignavibacteriales bacterium]|nr:NUDIX domain-containing protein [Ignavibacteriales bacterium]
MSHIIKDVLKNLSIDCTIFGFDNSRLEILLIKRARKPGKGMWALPGGFIKKEELLEDAAQRILNETTGIKKLYLEQMGVFDGIDRYPYWRVVTIGYFALVSPEHYRLSPGIDTTEARWYDLKELPELPFDHKHIIEASLNKLRARVRTKPIGFELLPESFSLPQLQKLYEAILDKELDKRNFRKKIMSMDILVKLDEKDKSNKKRAAYLYKFDRNNYKKLVRSGFIFEI